MSKQCEICEKNYLAAVANFGWRSKSLMRLQEIIERLTSETEISLSNAMTGPEIQEHMEKCKKLKAFEEIKPQLIASRDRLRRRVIETWLEKKGCPVISCHTNA